MKGTTKSLGKKELNDKFYTPVETASYCLSLLDIGNYDKVIEPSAGNGSFSKQVPGCIALDICPEDTSIKEQDFLSYTPFFRGKILVVGNPPFGNQSSLAVKFFNHASEFADTIAFILPKSFRKSSVQRKLNSYFHLMKDIDISNSFLLNGKPYEVPCCFQIWKKLSNPRVDINIKCNIDLEFTDAVNSDFRVQRVGGNAGKSFLDKKGSESSNYYIKNNSEYSTEYLVNFINQNLSKKKSISDTAGPKSVSKSELFEVINNINDWCREDVSIHS